MVPIAPENPNADLGFYREAYKKFSWIVVEKQFSWYETGELNIAHEAIDKWARDRDKRDRRALIFDGRHPAEYSYQDLREASAQWANLLIENGFSEGDRIFVFLPACPEIYLSMLACARIGAIFVPLSSKLERHDIEVRLQNSKPKGIITHSDLADTIPENALDSVEKVFLVQGSGTGLFPNEISIPDALTDLPKKIVNKWLRGFTPLYIAYTSGGSGPPKGIVHAHRDMIGIRTTAKYVLNLNEGAISWTDGDPASMAATIYGALGAWLCGGTAVLQSKPFSASNWYGTIEKYRVSVWYTTPGTLDRLMEAGGDLPKRYDLSSLTHIAATGEILTPEQFSWTRENLHHSAHDTWWMAETGMICLANFSSMGIKPGSMGRPVPGIRAAVLDENGEELPDMTVGQLALKTGWPAMMTGLWEDASRFRAYFRFKDWFLTGDMVVRDEDGYFFHHGRNDDLIKLDERLIGPYEIEQLLTLHPAVDEVVVISLTAAGLKPVMKAFVTVGKGFRPSKRLAYEIKLFIKANFDPQLPLERIEFLEEIPKTRSGKILRRVLRAKELGLPSGDIMLLKE